VELRPSTSTIPRSVQAIGGGLLAAGVLAAGLVFPPPALAEPAAGPAAERAGPAARPTDGRLALAAAGLTAVQPTGAAGHTSGQPTGAGGLTAGRLAGAAGTATSGPCARSLNVVAHQDDDLLFINPAVSDDIASGRCVVTVFITAGDAGRRAAYWRGREMGAMAAYAAMADVPNEWFEDTMLVAGHRVARLSLMHTKIVLLFLRLPDAKGNPVRPGESLQGLWRGQIRTIGALDSAERYTRTGLIHTLTSLMDAYQPDEIRTLDYEGSYGDGDHADHHTAGYLTYEAQRNYRSAHRISGYLGYPAEQRAENLAEDVRDRKLDYFLAYAPFDPKVCQVATDCLSNFYAPRFKRTVSTGGEVVAGRNVATQARVHASSANSTARQLPSKAVDGAVAGAPAAPASEWNTRGTGPGSWISLGWPAPQRLNQIDLFDRPNPYDQVTSGTLAFSDGTVIKVGPLPNNGTSKVIRFSPREVTAVRFRIDEVSRTTRSAGLAEVRTYTVAPATAQRY
jgi:LmbE family N-acetylglucosaminyl deacetylase